MLNLLLSFLFFIGYLFYPQRVEFKIVTTLSFLKSGELYHNYKILTFALGDYLITRPNLFNWSILFFLLGNLNPLHLLDLFLLNFSLTLFFFFPQSIIYLYISNHLRCLFLETFFYSHLLLVFSDLIIGVDEYLYPLKNSRYLTYPVYYLSLWALYYGI